MVLRLNAFHLLLLHQEEQEHIHTDGKDQTLTTIIGQISAEPQLREIIITLLCWDELQLSDAG